MDHDLTTAPGAVAADGLPSGGPDTGGAAAGAVAGAAAGTPAPSRPHGARGGIPGQAGAGVSGGASSGASGAAASGAGAAGTAGAAPGAAADGGDDPGAGPGDRAGAADSVAPVGTVRLASPGSVVASIPFLFGFHPENSLVVLGVSHSAEGGSFIRHGVRIDLDQVRGHERSTALELAARLRDQNADIAILVAFGPRGATGAKARPDHCRKLMAAFRAQLEAAASEERVTVVDALYTANGRWWSYMCRNSRCCPSAGTVVPSEAPAALAGAFAARGHTVYASREALDATLDPYPPQILGRTAAAVEQLDPAWYDTDSGLADARRLMDVLLARCGADSDGPAPRSARPEGPRAGRRGLSGAVTAALSTEHPGSQPSETDSGSADEAASGSGATGSARSRHGGRSVSSEAAMPQAADGSGAVAAAEQSAAHANGTAPHSAGAVIPAARSSRRVTNRVPVVPGTSEGPLLAEPPGSLLAPPVISDAEAAELLVALLNWRVRDYLACAAATVDSAGRLLRLGAELARRAPHPDLRLAPYALAAWAAWAIGRPAIAQCAVDRALAIDPEYKFASLIRAGLHHAIDGEGVRESAANTRREMFSEAAADPDAPGRDATGRDHADRDGTDPDGIDLDGTDLDGTDLDDTDLAGTDLAGTDLDTAPAHIPSPRSTKKVRIKTETDLESP